MSEPHFITIYPMVVELLQWTDRETAAAAHVAMMVYNPHRQTETHHLLVQYGMFYIHLPDVC